MARVLYDGLVEYEDGTPATTSQMAKDVVEFLNWSAEPEMDARKKMGLATVIITTTLLALSIWVKRYAQPVLFRWVVDTNECFETDTNGRLSRRERLSTILLLLEAPGRLYDNQYYEQGVLERVRYGPLVVLSIVYICITRTEEQDT